MKVKYDHVKLVTDFNKYMKENSLTLREFKEISGVSASTLSRMINNTNQLTTKNIMKIIEGIGGNLSDYLCDNAYFLNIDNIDIESLSIEALDNMINKLLDVRDRKVYDELDKIEHEHTILTSRESYLKRLIN